MNPRAQKTGSNGSPNIADEMVERLLADWSGLRYYLRRRKAGEPADKTMDTLLSEVLRTRLPGDANIPAVVRQLTIPRA